MTATQRRQVVTHLRAAFPVSARRACRVVGLSRSRWQYQPVRPARDRPVRERLRALAAARPRFGYQRLGLLRRREGLVVNHKRIYRLYREDRLLVRPPPGSEASGPAAGAAGGADSSQRALGDGLHPRRRADGRRFRCLTMVDVIGVLEQLAGRRGLPRSLVVDHGPEFISRALDLWAYRRRIELVFIRPGKPVENAYVESFHSRFRDECLVVLS